MFVRWQSRERRTWDGKDATVWSAILVESKRIGGTSTQKHVAFLGSFKDYYRGARFDFWDDISARLEGLANRISAHDRTKIEAAIHKKVPRPAAEEYKQAARDRVESLGWDWFSEHHPKMATALADEADQWKGREAGLLLKMRGEARCRFCQKPRPSTSFTAMCNGERNYFCDACIVAGLQLLENSVVDQKASRAPDCVHHTQESP
jgi:hypothetical protein